MAELKVPQIPPEMAYEQLLNAMGARDSTILQAFVDEFGSEKVQKMIYPRLKELGKQMAAMAPQMGITGKDAIAIASLIHIFEKQLLKIEGEPTEVSPERVVKKITKCPFQNLPLDHCLSYLGSAEGIVEGINPEYKFIQTKIIPKGDPICEWIIQKR